MNCSPSTDPCRRPLPAALLPSMEDFGMEDELMDWSAPFPTPLPSLPEADLSTERAVSPGEREWSCGLTTGEHNEISVRSHADHGCFHSGKKTKGKVKKGQMT